jgi:hypothetical protein
MKTSWLAAALFLVACGPHGPPCSFALDPAFTPDERWAFQQAADAWFMATNGRAEVDFDATWPADDEHYVVRKHLPNKWGVAYWHYGPFELSKVQDHIAINADAIPLEHLPWTIAHEVFHHWGAGHSKDPNDLMHNPSANQISTNDAIRFCNIHGC